MAEQKVKLKEKKILLPLTDEQKEKLGKTAFKSHEKLVMLRKGLSRAFLEFGRLFKENRDNRYYEVLGYETFAAYVATPEVGFAPSTAYCLIKIYTVVKDLKINEKVFEDLTYVKFRMLIPYINDENKEELLQEAVTLSQSDLDVRMRERKANKGFRDFKSFPKIWRCKECGKFKTDAIKDDWCKCGGT